MRIFLILIFVLLLISISLFLFQFENIKKNGNTLRLIFGPEPKSLDPAAITGLIEARYADALFEGLLSYDPETQTIFPAAAENYEISDDAKTYTFHIRTKPEQPRWSNGDLVTAYDFEYSFFRILTPETASEYVNLMFPIENAYEYYKGKVSKEKVGIKAKDSLTLEVRLKEPCPYFLDLVAFTTYLPVHRKTVEKYKSDWIKPGNIVSNGAFVLSAWKYNSFLKFEKNKYYWNRDKIRLDAIIAYTVSNGFTALNLYERNIVDFTTLVPAGYIDRLKTRDDFYYHPSLATTFLRFNVTKEPFNNPEVRKAFGIAIDREKITKYITRGGEVVTYSLCPEGIYDYKPSEGIKTNPELARKLLSQARFFERFKNKKIELLIPASETARNLAEMIQSQWKKELNVSVEIISQEWKVYLVSVKSLNYDVCYSNWIGDYNDPSTFFDIMKSESGNNRTGWRNMKYDELVSKAASEKDKSKRWVLYQQAEKILVEDEYPIVPLFHNVNVFLCKSFVKGIKSNLRAVYPLRKIFIEK